MYQLRDLIDLEQFQRLQDRLNEICPVTSAIIDNDGNILMSTNWQDICKKFHRQHAVCAGDCVHSDQYIATHLNEANPAVSYICPRGLVDCAMPIIIDGVHYANFFIGQIFLQAPDMDFFAGQARQFGFNREAYLESVKKVPVWNRAQLDNYLAYVNDLVQLISDSGLKKIREAEARKKIEENEDRDNLILREMVEGLLVVDTRDMAIVDVNEAMCHILGRERRKIIGETAYSFEQDGSRIKAAARMKKVLVEGSGQFEMTFRREDGALVDCEVSANYLSNRGLIFGLCRDISERKRNELIVRENLEWRYTFKEIAMDGYWLLDSQGHLLEVNDTYCRMSGYSAEELLGMQICELDASESPEETAAHLSNIICAGVDRFTTWHRRKDGSLMEIEVSAQYMPGNGGQIVSFLRDITEQKKADDELRRGSEVLKAILNAAQEAVFLMTTGGVILTANETTAKRLGRRLEDVIGQSIFNILPAEVAENRQKMVDQAVAQRKSVHVTDRRGEAWIENNIYPVFDPDGEIRQVAVYGRDVTEQKISADRIQQAQNELRLLVAEKDRSRRALLSVVEDQKEAQVQICKLNEELERRVIERTAQLEAVNQEMESFSYSVSHDLRAPLRALEGFSAMLIEDYGDKLDDLGKNYLFRIQLSSRRMAKLIDDLLNLSRITRHEVTLGRVDLSHVARQIAADLSEQFPDRQVRFDIKPHLTARADPNLIRIALENLLSNAFKFTAKRAEAVIQLGMVEQDGNQVYFVRDNGAGFDMAYADKLFKPFQRLHGINEYPGTGIGLTVVHRIISRHRGRIWPESRAGEGAVFYFTLASE